MSLSLVALLAFGQRLSSKNVSFGRRDEEHRKDDDDDDF